jgi:transposase
LPGIQKPARCGGCGIRTDRLYDKRWRRARDLGCGDREVYLDFEMRRVNCKTCGVKNEKLDFLSENTKYTLRFVMQTGGLCRAMTIKDVAKRMYLDWHTFKNLDKIYMREQIRRAGHPEPKVIGVDEIAIRKGHTYRIVVSD